MKSKTMLDLGIDDEPPLLRCPAEQLPLHIVGILLFGMLIGIVGRMLVGGESPWGWGFSIASGVGGAALGGYFGRVARLCGDGDSASFVGALLTSFSLVGIYHAIAVQRRRVLSVRR